MSSFVQGGRDGGPRGEIAGCRVSECVSVQAGAAACSELVCVPSPKQPVLRVRRVLLPCLGALTEAVPLWAGAVGVSVCIWERTCECVGTASHFSVPLCEWVARREVSICTCVMDTCRVSHVWLCVMCPVVALPVCVCVCECASLDWGDKGPHNRGGCASMAQPVPSDPH